MAQIIDVAEYFLHLDDQSEGDGISNLKLQKLCYYAQGFHLAIHDNPLFTDPVMAWTHGPVVVDLYHLFKEYGKNNIPMPENLSGRLMDQEKELITEVFQVFGQFSAWKLRNMTHEEPLWINHENEADEIPVDEMKAYFKTRIH